MTEASVYTSGTGFTAEYAKMFGEETGLRCLTLKEAKKELAPGAEIIYFGWIMADNVKGCKKAMKRYSVRAVVGVGLGPCGSRLEEVAAASGTSGVPLFTLQGGFDISKLHGVYKLMMKIFTGAVTKKLNAKPKRTPDEEKLLALMRGGSAVSRDNLLPVLDFYKETQ